MKAHCPHGVAWFRRCAVCDGLTDLAEQLGAVANNDLQRWFEMHHTGTISTSGWSVSQTPTCDDDPS
jgi:hypothetical protein